MIDLYTAATPNGHKVSVALEELGLPYTVHEVDLAAGEQKTPAFLRLNPNGRIPVIVDHDAPSAGPAPATQAAGPSHGPHRLPHPPDPSGPAPTGFVVFESGAILLYLAEKTGRLMPSDAHGRSLVVQWLMFQMAGVGPMMGQANVFFRYLPEKIPTAIARYQNESRRLFEVLDRRLAEAEWLAGSYSIADIAHWCWVRTYRWSGVSVEGLPHLRRWLDAMKARPACQRGLAVPRPVASVLRDEEATQAFTARAQQMVQR